MRQVVVATLLLSGGIFACGSDGGPATAAPSSPAEPTTEHPRAVQVARATTIPVCTAFVDAAASKDGDGSAGNPRRTIGAAVEAAAPGAVICIAEGVYPEQIAPGEKYFTLAGGFQRGSSFKVRDSATYVTKAQGKGGSFIRIEDPAAKNGQLTAIDGFEITGYSQAVVRDFYESQRFDVTNNYIHDNVCADLSLAGGGLALNNVTGTIKGNVFANNSCGRGGAVFLNDTTNQNTVSIENNRIDGNAGAEPDSSHGGALYLFGNTLKITANEFTNNSVTQWGAGLYVGAYTPGNQPTTATLAWNVYRGNRAGDAGGGFFCDDGATCLSDHEVYDRNCGGNILVDGGAGGSGPTVAKFDHITNFGALDPGCGGPGAGVFIDTYEGVAPDSYSFTNAIFWGNAPERDFRTSCGSGCKSIKVKVSFSVVQTKYEDGGIAIDFGEGNIAPADPLFVAPEAGDFRLHPTSPLIGKGTPAGTTPGAYGTGSEVAAARVTTATEPAPAKAENPANEAGKTAAEPIATPSPPPAGAPSDVSAKDAFEAAKELGTAEGWNAFLASYATGFYADLARAYLKKLGAAPTGPSEPAPATVPEIGTSEPAPAASPPEALAAPVPPAVARSGDYMGFPEKFNRYYTDSTWKPSKILYVSPDGGGDGTTRDKPMSVKDAVTAAQPGTMIYFLRGAYQGCFEFSKENSGTYDEPVVLYAERAEDKSVGVSMHCCDAGRQTCFNLEDADYIALDGFALVGGQYGVRAVGAGFPASEHSRGLAVLNCKGHDQGKDPFFSGQSDWNVWESNVASGAKKGDGHGIYLSNGSDWNIVRLNETFGNLSSDFQINADPASTCAEVGILFTDPQCDAYAGEGEGGQGASDYFLVDGNYFHHGYVGPNFTSVRRSVVRNNIFGPQTRHNVTFWQETPNSKLGSSDNKIMHNLFITNGRHGLKFENNSTRNLIANNILLGIQAENGTVQTNPSALLMEVDGTVNDNVYRQNFYVAGKMEGRSPNGDETAQDAFSIGWFTNFPAALNHDANDFRPSADAPFLGLGALLPEAPQDLNGSNREQPTDLGPIELR